MTSFLLACLSNIFEWRTKLDASHVSVCAFERAKNAVFSQKEDESEIHLRMARM